MKNYFVILLSLFVILSCNSENGNNVSEPINKKKTNIIQEEQGTMTSPDRHWCWDSRRCKLPKYDCFPDIIIYGDKAAVVNQLDYYISVNQVNTFFNGVTYEVLFPGLYGQAFYDLRDSITTLRKAVVNESTVLYHIVYLSDTTLAPNYSSYY
jgi:hypothetical protein